MTDEDCRCDNSINEWPIRFEDKNVDVATNLYVHETTGRRVWLTGMLHMADRHFYLDLREDMLKAETDGVTIQYEMVRKGDEADARLLDPGPAAALLLNRLYGALLLCEMADMCGLSVQYLLNPPDSWVNADITDVEMMRLLGSHALPHAKKMRRIATTVSWMRPLWRGITGRAIRFAVKRAFPDMDTMERAAKHKPEGKVIVEHRNAVALEHLLGTDSEVWTSWGGGHIPGIHDGLLEAGFCLTDQTWRTAIASRSRKDSEEANTTT